MKHPCYPGPTTSPAYAQQLTLTPLTGSIGSNVVRPTVTLRVCGQATALPVMVRGSALVAKCQWLQHNLSSSQQPRLLNPNVRPAPPATTNQAQAPTPTSIDFSKVLRGAPAPASTTPLAPFLPVRVQPLSAPTPRSLCGRHVTTRGTVQKGRALALCQCRVRSPVRHLRLGHASPRRTRLPGPTVRAADTHRSQPTTHCHRWKPSTRRCRSANSAATSGGTRGAK